MASDNMGRDRELVLPPNTYAYVLDSTKGNVNVYVGPKKDSLSSTDQLVEWDDRRGRITAVSDVERATQVFAMAGEGQYIVLTNPFKGDGDKQQHPPKGTVTPACDLEAGRKVNVPGPASFPLWPGQTAQTIEGHHLRNNQYLLVRVRDEQQAKKNWRSAVVVKQAPKGAPVPQQGAEGGEHSEGTASAGALIVQAGENAPALTMGQLMVVKGTEVSFYIPPTGIEVVPENGGNFVREAVTLERLEYCILLDENGEKSYRQGPKVVFPTPTQKFVEGGDGNRKFMAIELNEQSGLYVKVIDAYEEGGLRFKVGDELFITGKEQAIYYPRPEHSIIEYGNKRVHYAIAIPEGEGRYVLDRNKGAVDLKVGPKMFLPDPRNQVIVRRILDPHTVELMFPGNKEAAAVNAKYKEMSAGVTSGGFLESAEAKNALLSQAVARGVSDQFAGDSFTRTTSYSPPRTLVLDTKYEGAVSINIWPGYAVMVVGKTGERRVEVGPKMILLEYGETLMPLELSTGKPKTDKYLFRTAYLRVTNNQVSDVVTVETKDSVKVCVKISYRVNFEGETAEEQERWFGVENYVKVLTDHCRSRMCNFAKRQGIQEFYSKATDFIRDAILGEVPEGGKRPGLPFNENGMRVYDVEVLDVSMQESGVADLLNSAQEKAVAGAIQLSAAQEDSERNKELEVLKRAGLDEKELTAAKEAELAKTAINRKLIQDKAKVAAENAVAGIRRGEAERQLADTRKAVMQEVELARLRAAQEIERMQDETNEYVARTAAVTPDMIASLQMFGDQLFVEKVTQAVAPLALATGVTTADILGQVFKGTPFEGVMQNLASRPLGNKSRD